MEVKQKFIKVKKLLPSSKTVISLDSPNKLEGDLDIIITDDDEIKKLYNDLNVGLNIFIKERFVKLEGDNLILKRSSYEKNRRIGKRFFQKKLDVDYLKFNLKTGNFITVRSFGGMKRKRTVIIRQNVFGQLEEMLQSNEDSAYGTFWSSFNEPDTDGEMLAEIFDCLFDTVDPKYRDSFQIDQWLYQIFIDKKGIKPPDVNTKGLLTKFYPTEKYFKKKDRKLVQSVLDLLEMKDNFTIKLLHKYPFIDMRMLKTLHVLFGGSKYLSNVDDVVFKNMQCRVFWDDYNINKFTLKHYIKDLNDLPELWEIEKSNLVKVLNGDSSVSNHISTSKSSLLYDHFNMLRQIRVYNPDLYMSTTTLKTMNEEHIEFADMVSKINKGYVVSYRFNELMVKDVESPLGIDENTYYPYILKNEDDYNEEGSFMRHCISSYYDKEKSIIVSLRKDNERWTCEFDVANGVLVQMKGRFNSDPPSFIMDMVENNILKKTRTWSRANKLKCIEKVETPLLINGKAVERPQYSIPESTGDLPF